MMVEIRAWMVCFFLGGCQLLQPTLELSDKWVIKNSTSRQGAFYADAEQPIQAQREVDGISHKYL